MSLYFSFYIININENICYIQNSFWVIFIHHSLTHNWRRKWQPTPVLLLGESHGQRSPVGCSPWGRSESDTTELLHFHFSLSWIGEGDDNPLRCSCLENTRDGGAAWWAPVYRVTQSQTGLKWLISSSSKLITSSNLWSFYCLHNFAFLRISHCWNMRSVATTDCLLYLGNMYLTLLCALS